MRTMDTMFFVSWEHEYFTDDDQAMFDTLAEAQAFQVKLQGLGKRRIMISGPGIEEEDYGF